MKIKKKFPKVTCPNLTHDINHPGILHWTTLNELYRGSKFSKTWNKLSLFWTWKYSSVGQLIDLFLGIFKTWSYVKLSWY